jgi:hypothetical protein
VFSTSAYVVTESTPDHLLITMPGNSLGWPWLYVFFLAFFLVAGYLAERSTKRVMRPLKPPAELRVYMRRFRFIWVAIAGGALGFFWLIAYSSGSIELDRRSDIATLRAKFTAFLPAQTISIPLSAVNRATLDAMPNARRIRLVANDGRDLSYPLWTDRPGQGKAVQAINRFLACAGCDVGVD